MANNDGFGSSEIMYPTVTVPGAPGAPGGPMMPATPYAAPAMPAFGGSAQHGPELINGTFNQTWLMNCLRRRWVLALFMGSLFAAGVAALLLWLFPLSSSISALVHIQQETTNVMNEQERFSPQKLEVFQETQLALIKSQFVLQAALNRSKISQLEAVKKEEPDPITWLQDYLKVSFYGETLALRYDGEEDINEMKEVVNAVIEAYEKEVVGEKRIRAHEMYDNLLLLHKDLSEELKEKILNYETLVAEIGGAESPIANSVLNMLINEVRQIQAQIMKKREELVEITVVKTVAEQQAKSTTALEQAVAEMLDADPMLANFKADVYVYMTQIRALKARSKTGTSAEIKRLENTLAQMDQESRRYRMDTEASIRKDLKNAPNDMLAAMTLEYIMRSRYIKAEVFELKKEYEEKVAEIEQKGERSGKLAMLDAEILQLQEIDQEMDYKLRSWKIENEASKDLFRVIQPATATPQINTVQRYTLACLGGIAAFCATCYGVALIEFRRRRLNGASDMDEGLGLRVLGVLPSVSSRKAMAPGSMIAAQLSESIDNVRATLLHDSTTNKRQVILITSPATLEGTTTVASHLALSLTRAGRRTLLVDGDIREPALHKMFGMPLDEGFCEVLRTDVDVADVIRPTNTEGLWLLTAGHCDMDAIHALATDQPQPIFEKLREEFDFIIIDGAPVLGLADSISIGQHVDGVILTVLRDHSEVRKVYQAIELLKSMGIRLLGSVVNGVPIKADRRIAQMQQSNAKKPRKIAATATSNGATSKAKKSKVSAKAKEPTTDLDDIADLNDGMNDGMNDRDLNDDVEINFDDFDLDDKS